MSEKNPLLRNALLRTYAFAALAMGGFCPALASAQTTPSSDRTAPRPVQDAPTPPSDRTTSETGNDRIPASQPVAPAMSSTSVVGGKESANPYERFDALMEPGFTSTFPGSEDSVLRDTGGFRSWLADHDTGVRIIIGNTASIDVLPTGGPRSPQRFNGQRFTLQSQSGNIGFSTTLRSIGLPNTRFFYGAGYLLTGYYVNGPSTAWIRSLGIYQSFANGRITVKAGITPNYYEYVGFFTGGSPVLASGLPGLLPIQAGLGVDPAGTPLVNVTGYGSNGKYIRFGVQRSVSPQGVVQEVRDRDNGIKLGARGAGPLYIGEIGVRRPAKPGHKQIWLRAGGFYNDSDYTRFDGGGTRSNASVYALADRQLTQPDQTRPGRGLYAGASFYWIPKEVNTSTQSYEGRIYGIGLMSSRPKDTVALRVTYYKFSDDARDAALLRGDYANSDQLNATLSYSAHLHHGIYFTPGVSYIKHPSFIGDFNDALTLSAALFFVL